MLGFQTRDTPRPLSDPRLESPGRPAICSIAGGPKPKPEECCREGEHDAGASRAAAVAPPYADARRVARGMPLRVSGFVGCSPKRLKAAGPTRGLQTRRGAADGARNPKGIPGEPEEHPAWVAWARKLLQPHFGKKGSEPRAAASVVWSLPEVGCQRVVGLKQEPGLE